MCVFVAVFLFYLHDSSADSSDSTGTRRWGITPKESLEDEEKENGNKVRKTPAASEANQNEGLPNDKKATSRESILKKEPPADKKTEHQINGQKPNAGGTKGKADPSTGKSDTKAPENTTKKPENQKQAERIKWKDEKQKIKCEAYLGELKENFLKARHYSIQGEPCGTAEYSQNFLKAVEKCKQDCPKDFLAQKGYTKRIVRNLSWLKKLGTERCPEMNSNAKSLE